MSDSIKLAKFVSALAIVLAVFSIIDMAYYIFTLNVGIQFIKSLGVLSLSVLCYRYFNKLEAFKAGDQP